MSLMRGNTALKAASSCPPKRSKHTWLSFGRMRFTRWHGLKQAWCFLCREPSSQRFSGAKAISEEHNMGVYLEKVRKIRALNEKS